MFSEGDHEGRILQNCLQLLPGFILCGAEQGGVKTEAEKGRDADIAMKGKEGGPATFPRPRGFLRSMLPRWLG